MRMKRSFDVVTIGAATQDVFLRSRHLEQRRDSRAPDGLDAIIRLGTKIHVDELAFSTGGGATNASVTFARLGLKTACISCIGKDERGELLVHELQANHVHTSLLQRDSELQTGYSVILLNHTGHRAIFTYRGASNHIQSSSISWKTLSTRAFYLTSVGGNLGLVRAIFTHATKYGSCVAWNPGNAELEQGPRNLAPYLASTDILILNRDEASMLTGKPKRQLQQIIHALVPMIRGTLVITDGEQGAYVVNEHERLYSPILPGTRVNTTGAGDAYGSGFAGAIFQKKDSVTSMRVAMLNATGVVTHMGAKAGIIKKFPSKKELERVHVYSC